jgi:hypothetical protein
MAGFERGQDALGAGEQVEGRKRFRIGDADVFGAASIFQEGMLGTDARIVQSCRHRMRLDDLAVVVAQHVGAVAVQHAGPTGCERSRVMTTGQPFAGGLGADDAHARVVEEGVEQADRVGAAAHAGSDHVGQPAVFLQHLRACLAADDGVEVAHHQRIGMRPGHRADDVESVGNMAHPVAHRLVERVLERLRARGHRHHFGAQQLHAVDVDLLPLDVGGAHVDHALEAQPRRHRGAGHAVLARAGLGDDACLAHVPRHQRLADGVVDLVRAGVVQVLALEQDARTADLAAQTLGEIHRARPADVVLEVIVELGEERWILAQAQIRRSEFGQRRHQRLGDVLAAVIAEAAVRVGPAVEILHGWHVRFCACRYEGRVASA